MKPTAITREKAGDGGRQPRGPFVHAERVEGRGAEPVLQRRLLEVLEAVQARREPVAADGHLARDLGVAPLVGVLQVARVERREPRDERRRVPAATRRGGEGRRASAAGASGGPGRVPGGMRRAFYRALACRPAGRAPRALRGGAVCAYHRRMSRAAIAVDTSRSGGTRERGTDGRTRPSLAKPPALRAAFSFADSPCLAARPLRQLHAHAAPFEPLEPAGAGRACTPAAPRSTTTSTSATSARSCSRMC